MNNLLLHVIKFSEWIRIISEHFDPLLWPSEALPFRVYIGVSPVYGGSRIHRLHSCIWLRPPPNECPKYDIKPSDGQAPALKIWGMWGTPSLPLLPNSPAQAESPQRSLERRAPGIGSYVNADKTEYMWFNQRGNISTLKCGPLELVDNDINTWLAKAWTAIDRLSVI